DDLARRAASSLRYRLELRRARLHGLSQKLESLNPMAILRRGYAIVTRADDGRLVHSGDQVTGGDGLRVRVSDAVIHAQVQHIAKEGA
ncbi:MAG: exodeoxyribonuclease VII large subunit, partial [Anaerolineales bacterium]